MSRRSPPLPPLSGAIRLQTHLLGPPPRRLNAGGPRVLGRLLVMSSHRPPLPLVHLPRRRLLVMSNHRPPLPLVHLQSQRPPPLPRSDSRAWMS